ncbi:MAG: ABC transporter substrate-binding protein [Candidatus Sumerlaeaceae bacterium]
MAGRKKRKGEVLANASAQQFCSKWPRRTILAFFLFLLIVVYLYRWATHPPAVKQAEGQVKRDRLRYAMGETLAFSEPALAQTTENALWLAQVCEGLVRFHADSVEVEPALAESYSVSPDGKEWTFRLRQNVQFHDGTLLDASAVRFGFMRLVDPNHPYHLPAALPVARAIFGDERTPHSCYLRDIRTPDDHTVVLVFSQPDAGLLRRLARVEAALNSPRAVQTAAAEGQTTVVGTGPMRVKFIRQGFSVTLERNEAYWGKLASIRELEFRSVPETNDRERALREGQCDIAQRFPPARSWELRQTKNLKVYDGPAMHQCVLWLNLNSAPLNEVAVRSAIAVALDRKAATDSMLRRFATPAYSFFPVSVGDGPTTEVLPRGAERARAKLLLEQVGFNEGFTLKLLTPSEEKIWNPVGKALGVWLADQLRDLKINLVCETLPTDEVRRRIMAGDFQAALWGLATPAGDAVDFVRQLMPLAEVSGAARLLSQPPAAELLGDATRAATALDRQSAMTRLNAWLAKNLPWVPLFQAHQAIVCRREIGGFILNPLGQHRLWELWWDIRR